MEDVRKNDIGQEEYINVKMWHGAKVAMSHV